MEPQRPTSYIDEIGQEQDAESPVTLDSFSGSSSSEASASRSGSEGKLPQPPPPPQATVVAKRYLAMLWSTEVASWSRHFFFDRWYRRCRGKGSHVEGEMGQQLQQFQEQQPRGFVVTPEVLQEAKDHLRRGQCTKPTEAGVEPWNLWTTTLDDLGTYGTGIELYFRFTAQAAKVVFVAALTQVPLLLLSSSGNTLMAAPIERRTSHFMTKLAQTTIGNLGFVDIWTNPDVEFSEQVEHRAVHFLGMDIKSVTLFTGVLDAMMVIFVFVAVIWFEFHSLKKVVRAHATDRATPEAFALCVRGIPKSIRGNPSLYTARLAWHFEQVLKARIVRKTAVEGTLVVLASDSGNLEAAARERCWRRALRRAGCDLRGRRLGRIVSKHPHWKLPHGTCEVEWSAFGDLPACRNAERYSTFDDGVDGVLLDAALLEKLERQDLSPTGTGGMAVSTATPTSALTESTASECTAPPAAMTATATASTSATVTPASCPMTAAPSADVAASACWTPRATAATPRAAKVMNTTASIAAAVDDARMLGEQTSRRSTPVAGAVHEVSIVRDLSGKLSELKHMWQQARAKEAVVRTPVEGPASPHIACCRPIVDELEQSSELDDVRPKTLPEINLDKQDALMAYVIFNRVRQRDFIHSEYSSIWQRWFPRKAYCFADQPLRTEDAPTPSDIVWENLDFAPQRRRARRCTSILACLALLIVCLLIFTGLKHLSITAANLEGAGCDPLKGVGVCECEERGLRNVFQDHPPGIYSRCQDWLAHKVKGGLLAASSSIMLIIINYAATVGIGSIADFERPTSLSQRSHRIMAMGFLVQLINVGVITMFVHFDLKVNFLGDGIMGLIGNGLFSDLVFEWYNVVGASMILTGLLQACCPLINLLWTLATKLHRTCAARKQRSLHHLFTLYTYPHFELAAEHAQQLCTIFVIFVFSPGMPILLMFLPACLALYYWVDRYILLRESRVPPRYGSGLCRWTIRSIPVALWLHCLMAVWVYGQPKVTPSFSMTQSYCEVYFNQKPGCGGVLSPLLDRMRYHSALPSAVVLLGLSVFLSTRLLIMLISILGYAGHAVLIELGLRTNRTLRTSDLTGSKLDRCFATEVLEELRRAKCLHSYNMVDVQEYSFLKFCTSTKWSYWEDSSEQPSKAPSHPSQRAHLYLGGGEDDDADPNVHVVRAHREILQNGERGRQKEHEKDKEDEKLNDDDDNDDDDDVAADGDDEEEEEEKQVASNSIEATAFSSLAISPILPEPVSPQSWSWSGGGQPLPIDATSAAAEAAEAAAAAAAATAATPSQQQHSFSAIFAASLPSSIRSLAGISTQTAPITTARFGSEDIEEPATYLDQQVPAETAVLGTETMTLGAEAQQVVLGQTLPAITLRFGIQGQQVPNLTARVDTEQQQIVPDATLPARTEGFDPDEQPIVCNPNALARLDVPRRIVDAGLAEREDFPVLNETVKFGVEDSVSISRDANEAAARVAAAEEPCPSSTGLGDTGSLDVDACLENEKVPAASNKRAPTTRAEPGTQDSDHWATAVPAPLSARSTAEEELGPLEAIPEQSFIFTFLPSALQAALSSVSSAVGRDNGQVEEEEFPPGDTTSPHHVERNLPVPSLQHERESASDDASLGSNEPVHIPGLSDDDDDDEIEDDDDDDSDVDNSEFAKVDRHSAVGSEAELAQQFSQESIPGQPMSMSPMSSVSPMSAAAPHGPDSADEPSFTGLS